MDGHDGYSVSVLSAWSILLKMVKMGAEGYNSVWSVYVE